MFTEVLKRISFFVSACEISLASPNMADCELATRPTGRTFNSFYLYVDQSSQCGGLAKAISMSHLQDVS